MNGKPITTKKYWDSVHNDKIPSQSSGDEDLNENKLYSKLQIYQKILKYYKKGKIIEVGAGSSDWLIKFAKELDHEGCVGLDYSLPGCFALEEKVKANNLEGKVTAVCADMFDPPAELGSAFSFVFTYGVVEHFEDTVKALWALGKFAKKDGIIFSVIPNMSGLCGYLTKKWAPEIYKMHVPLDLSGFENAHISANLKIIYSGYLCSVNLGVISSCFPKREYWNLNYYIYIFLVRLNLILWWFERHFCRLPASKTLSPYILIISQLQR